MTVTAKPPSTQDRPAEHGGARDSLLTKVLVRQETTLVLVMIAIGVFATARSALFLSESNLTSILRSSVIYFVMACGAALLVIGGGLDFSAGAVFTLGALSTCKLLVEGVPWPLAVPAGLAVCCAVGAVNFAVVTYLHVPPIIATLGTFYMLTGIDNLVTDGADVLPLPAGFQRVAQGSVLGVSNDVLIAVAVGVLFWFLLERTRFGVNVRALGGNRQAAVGNGLRVFRLDLALYVIAAATAALAGVVYSAQVGAGQVTAGGTSTTLNAVTAVLIGGVSLMGGMGSVQGVAVGAVLLSLIDNALVLTGIPPQYNSIVIGAILVSAVAVDHLRRARIYRKR
ncbi:ABC transporter permease [Umezawaea tangerina]|uniref:Autoinducer 2 import system permease protein LsrD n=1 Tax=Umezawaea tangerina TaxID=84725 RepID=A0A2T0T1W6_9PSEU|nr:ABC transporter permease [Umezawaea tangerina]PRY39641.1 ribose transport system permease protein [Umezawaea tangerina]